MITKLNEIWAAADSFFWLAIFCGIALKIVLSDKITKRSLGLSIVAGVFCAVFFTEPVLEFLLLEGGFYERGLAAIFALTGENIVRRILAFSKSGKISDIKKGL